MGNDARKQMVLDWLSQVAELKIWNPEEENIPMYVSKVDGSYLCFNNLYMDLEWMLNAGITEHIQCSDPNGTVANIGFNPLTQKWHGWSHRAYYGFGIGDEIKFGNAGYVAKNTEDLIRQAVDFWKGDAHVNVSGIIATNDKGITGVQVTWEYDDRNVPNKSLHGTIGECFFYPPKQWGRGEWKAETLEDCKQMAIDFAESVS